MKKATKTKTKLDAKAPAPHVSLTDFNNPASLEAFRKASREITEELTRTKQASLDYLVSLGIYTKSGRLSKNYR